MTTQLDHIILLLSPADFRDVPSWLSDNFTIIDGGKHSKGTSQNKLIIFQDGTYLELFSWVDPQSDTVEPYADFPSWADKPEGHIIDWALTGSDAHRKHDEVMKQVHDLEAHGQRLGVVYDPPKEGGRRRMDGKELRWYATRPRPDNDSAQSQPKVDVPFFCHDITDRALRVPYTQESTDEWPRIVAHPCGATGIGSIAVDVPARQFDSCVKLYEGIFGTLCDGRHSTEFSMTSFTIASPARSVGKLGGTQCMVILRADEGMEGPAGQAGISIRSLKLWTSRQGRKGERINADDFKTEITLG